MDTWANYLATLPFVDLIGVDKPTAERRFRDALEGKHLELDRTPGSRKTPSGFQLLKTLSGGKGIVQRLAWSLNDEQTLAAPEQYGTVGLWNTSSGARLREYIDATNSAVAYNCVAWSPRSPLQELLAAGSTDGEVRLWNVRTGELQKLRIPTINPGNIPEYSEGVRSVAWSPDGRTLAVALYKSVLLWSWNGTTARYLRELSDHRDTVTDLAWSPDGTMLASTSRDQSVILWNIREGRLFRHFMGHTGAVNSVAWLFQQELIASGSDDGTIRLWNFGTGLQAHDPLRGHDRAVTALSFSYDGRFLASKSYDDTVRLWYFDNWMQVARLDEPSSQRLAAGLAFHPSKSLLATLDKKDTAISIWQLDFDALARIAPAPSTAYYCSAKVILVGNSGVGKTGLWNALRGERFTETEPTHALQVLRFDHKNEPLTAGHRETREIFLWDLAGQLHTRFTHQLYFDYVAVALVVFDANSEDPFTSIYYWVYALRQAQRMRQPTIPMKIFLVAARTDMGGISLSTRELLETLRQELGLDGYFTTSSRDGREILALGSAIRAAIDWRAFRATIDKHLEVTGTSIALSRQIESFLAEKKHHEPSFAKTDKLYQDFRDTHEAYQDTDPMQFRLCMKWAEMQGLVRRCIFDDSLLFRHELIGIYASALVNAIKIEPGDEGQIAEKRVSKGDFQISRDQRLPNRDEEKLLLIAMGEELLRQELAFRQDNGGWHLVFPSLCEHEDPAMHNPRGKRVSFDFTGSPIHIYATLVIRLKRSGRFHLDTLSKSVATYTTRSKEGAMYGIMLHDRGKGEGTLTLFFQGAGGEAQTVYDDMCLSFEKFVQAYLETRALPDSARREDIFACPVPTCNQFGKPIPYETVRDRRQDGLDWIYCQGRCNGRISLVPDRTLIVEDLAIVEEMDRNANSEAGQEADAFIAAAKYDDEDTGASEDPEMCYSVYCCYDDTNEEAVDNIRMELERRGKIRSFIIKAFLRRDQIAGTVRLRDLERKIADSQVGLVFVGTNNMHPLTGDSDLQQMESAVLLDMPNPAVIPVLLPELPEDFRLQGFLSTRNIVDFRQSNPDPFDELIQGIIGRRFSS